MGQSCVLERKGDLSRRISQVSEGRERYQGLHASQAQGVHTLHPQADGVGMLS